MMSKTSCKFCAAHYYVKTAQYTKPVLMPFTHEQELQDKLADLTGKTYVRIENRFCPVCGKAIDGSSQWICDGLPENTSLCLVACREWDMFEDDWSGIRFRLLRYLPDAGCWNIKTLVQVLAWMPVPDFTEGDVKS